MTVQDILAAASQLSQEERLQVAIRLLESLGKFHSVPQQKTESDPSWKTELHPLVQRLVGVVPSEDQDSQAFYVDYLEEKYS
jgi:hypothetical protein